MKHYSRYWRDRRGPLGRQWACIACAKRKRLVKYGSEPERFREASKKYYWENRDEVLRKAHENRRDNPEFHRARNRDYAAKYRKEKPWRGSVNYRRHREKHLAYQRDYRHRNAIAFRHRASVRRAKMRGATLVPFTAHQLDQRLQMFGSRCWICDCPVTPASMAIDHVKPLNAGGAHMLANLRPACRLCNARKHDTWPFSPELAWWLQEESMKHLVGAGWGTNE